MHGPAFILFGRGRPCILSVPAASGGPPDDRAPFLGLRACGPLAGLARRQKGAALFGPLYDGGAKQGRV